MRTRMLVCATAMVLVLGWPGVASADSGAITNVHPLGTDQVEATYASTSTTCSSTGFCGWYPHAVQVPATQACFFSTDHLTYVGDYQNTPGTQTATEFFYPAWVGPIRICLYISSPNDEQVLIAEYVYTPGAPAPAATTPTTPPSTQADVPPLTIAQARASLPGVLRDKFGVRFTVRRHFKRGCYRLLISTVRCRVRWDHGQWRYSGVVDMKNDPDDPANSIVYRTTVRRERLHTSSNPTTPAPGRPTAPSGCDPNYKGACLKPNVSDYDCAGGSGDGPYYVQGPITVVGDDHYGLDRDGDGIACES